jgi:hypothetical protein
MPWLPRDGDMIIMAAGSRKSEVTAIDVGNRSEDVLVPGPGCSRGMLGCKFKTGTRLGRRRKSWKEAGGSETLSQPAG